MPKDEAETKTVDETKLPLEKLRRAFLIFQEQSRQLEKSHEELRQKLDHAQLDLEDKNRQLALRVSEVESMRERLAGMLESINDAVLLVDGAGRAGTANKAAEILLGKNLSDGGFLLSDHPCLAPYARATEKIENADVEISSGGDRRLCLLSVIPTGSGGGMRVVSLKDVTEKRRLEERVNREDRLAALGRVAASVAHEIRNPLGAIEGFATLLERDLADNPKSKGLAGKIIYASRQLNLVVGNLLSHTREVRAEKTRWDVLSLLRDSMDLARPMAENRGVEVRVDVPEEEAWADVDPALFRQVLNNVIVNAVEACPIRSGGRVGISVSRQGRWLEISVSDNGGGIPPALKRQIFEPFFTMKEGGIGLGLSLCHRIMQAHGGEIFERGEHGSGAVFVIRLDVSED